MQLDGSAVRLAMGTAVALGLGRFAYGLLVPSMRAELGWTLAQAGAQTTANGLGYLAGALVTALRWRATAALSCGSPVGSRPRPSRAPQAAAGSTGVRCRRSLGAETDRSMVSMSAARRRSRSVATLEAGRRAVQGRRSAT
jgi:Uncharacterised MFS-type transporter YbfB